VSDAVADAATGLLKEAGVPHLMIENTPLRGFEDTIIEMIHDSLEKETNRFLLEEVLA
jgi:hypothetical protein